MIVMVVGLSLSERLDIRSSEQLDNALVRSLSTFALARTLNGLVSVVQGTELNVTPAGVGVTFAPGELLDPVNDMIERFSWVMLMSSVSIGVQEVTLHLGKSTLFKMLLALVALIVLLQLWLNSEWWPWRIERSLKLLVILTVLRFSVPLLVMMNEAVYQYVLEPEYTHSFREVTVSSEKVALLIDQAEVKQEALKEESSFLDSFNLSEKYRRFKASLQESVQEVIATFNESMDSIVRLITVFIINTILIPLVGLWLFLYGLGAFLREDFHLDLE